MTLQDLLPPGTTLVVERKAIKNLYLRVLPGGQIKVTAPRRTSDEAIGAFLAARRGWIEERLGRLEAQPVPTPRTYTTGETCWLWGKPYHLELVEGARNGIALEGGTLRLSMPPGATPRQREAVVEAWYRHQLAEAIPPVLARCQQALGTQAREWRIKRMTTRWGSCNPRAGRIWISLQLAERPPCCLEYLITHELAHLLVPGHGPDFWTHLDRACPDWRRVRKLLNQPLTTAWQEPEPIEKGRNP